MKQNLAENLGTSVATFNLLNKVRFLKVKKFASDFASRSYNMRMFNHATDEIKIILKMMPPEFTLKYDEKFTSESNADIL
ncbi:hypothetical protein GLOIN_2v1790077 [Rhizophagus irregularis DAOM 181602=DAOM 197198]|nr:hypothetical protein GLOIN_2v1790077 [Rhizophagus irregularis DAOM 181602=DAOM 197198]